MDKGEEIQGAVSLWVGFSPTKVALNNYTEADFTTDDSPHVSPMAKDFGTGWYDHDFMEIAMENSTQSLSELLQGCSYDRVIIPKFEQLCGEVLPEEVNAFVLLYNFQYNGPLGPPANSSGSVRLQYMGSIQVETPWPVDGDY